jgi:tRNA A-37 threonylcarbamoyl transferase component Bud32
MARDDVRVRLEGIPRHAWAVATVLVLSLLYGVLQIALVRPGLPADDPNARLPGVLLSRPPQLPAIADGVAAQSRAIDEWRRTYWDERPTRGWSEERRPWLRAHLGRILQVVAFIGAAIVLFALRSHDLTAALSVLALALSGVAAGGPLFGLEASIPLGRVLTFFAWLAGPCAFPVIALAILYFPTPSPWLARFPLLHVVPFVAATPMIGAGVMTAAYLAGVDGAREAALWDANHPGVFYGSFAAALGINVVAVIEGVHRYRFNHDANERRRIRMAVYTGVPGVLAYAVKDGVPIIARLSGTDIPVWPWPLEVFLQVLVLLPAFGLVYAVGVARVLGPRIVLRRSLQYALANRTLTILTILPAVALVFSLARNPDAKIRDVVTSVYLGLLLISVAAFAYRERARQWLDQRFFRQEYDARKILLSLASRVRFETDPSDLAAMVVNQLDEALHPELIAILVSGLDEGRLTPVTVLHGSAESLKMEGGLVAMLRWSDEPLEIFLNDSRSPVHRLPADEREWLECTRAVLLVPIVGQDKSLVGIVALGERRSEEAYTAEDRDLLASIAAQMGVGFDVARLRRRMETGADDGTEQTRLQSPRARPMMECARCGRCEDPDVNVCPADGSTMRPSPNVPRVLDDKYQLEQLLGRGGMGAVYRARDMRLDRLVAVKVVRAELIGDPEARRRFRREAQIVAKLQHPGIVAIFDYGTLADGAAYLVMELVRGEDLRRVLIREGRLDPTRVSRILSSVCSAIEAAHRQGVLHRDLKPENILLPGEDSEAKVLDFGVAKVISPERRDVSSTEAATVLTMEGTVVGTPAYMAPEQLRGQVPDSRTDVFSLGVIAYEMVTGNLPFGRGSLADVVLAQARGMSADDVDALPTALGRAIRAALEADPDRRPPSPQALAHLINAAGATG